MKKCLICFKEVIGKYKIKIVHDVDCKYLYQQATQTTPEQKAWRKQYYKEYYQKPKNKQKNDLRSLIWSIDNPRKKTLSDNKWKTNNRAKYLQGKKEHYEKNRFYYLAYNSNKRKNVSMKIQKRDVIAFEKEKTRLTEILKQ